MVPTAHSSAAVSNDDKQARAAVTFDRRVGANKIEENGHELGLQTWPTHQQKEHSPSPKDTSDSRDVLVEGTMRNSNCAKPRKTRVKKHAHHVNQTPRHLLHPYHQHAQNSGSDERATKRWGSGCNARAQWRIAGGSTGRAASSSAPRLGSPPHTHAATRSGCPAHTQAQQPHTPSTSRSHQATSARAQLKYFTGIVYGSTKGFVSYGGFTHVGFLPPATHSVEAHWT
jgi:hypothetical protein